MLHYQTTLPLITVPNPFKVFSQFEEETSNLRKKQANGYETSGATIPLRQNGQP
jgi:hypothetical protein